MKVQIGNLAAKRFENTRTKTERESKMGKLEEKKTNSKQFDCRAVPVSSKVSTNPSSIHPFINPSTKLPTRDCPFRSHTSQQSKAKSPTNNSSIPTPSPPIAPTRSVFWLWTTPFLIQQEPTSPPAMSLRPTTRTDVRKKSYKTGVDADEARRRREDNLVEIRKNKREDNLLKKRREGLLLHSQQLLDAAQNAAAVEKRVWFYLPLFFCLLCDLNWLELFLSFFLCGVSLIWFILIWVYAEMGDCTGNLDSDS